MKTPKKVLIFYTNIPNPYQSDFFDALAQVFTLTVVYYTQTEAGREWQIETDRTNYKTIFLNTSLLNRYWKTFYFSFSILKTFFLKADFVVVGGSYFVPNAVLAMIVSRLKGAQVAFFGEALHPTSSPAKRALKGIALLPLKLSCHSVIAVGQKAKASFQSYGFAKPIILIPYNINIDLFDKAKIDPTKTAELSQQYKKEGEIILLTSGALIARKAIDVLINAFQAIPPETIQHTKLLILGNGVLKSTLQDMVLPQYKDKIIFLGFQTKIEIPHYFAIADIFVFPSRYDGWGVVTNEAIAADLPIIACNEVSSANDWVVPGQNGFLFEKDDHATLTLKLTELINNNELRHAMSRYNHAFKQQTHSIYYANLLLHWFQPESNR